MSGFLQRIVTVALRGGVAAFALALCIHGSTKRVARSAAPARAVAQSATQAAAPDEITDADIARGWRLVSVATNAAVSYAMPTNGATCGKWHLRGAYEDVAIADFGDWRFPVGTGETSKVWAFVWGRVRPALRDAAHEIRAVDAPMSAIPSVSRLWTAATAEGGRLVTWKIPVQWYKRLDTSGSWPRQTIHPDGKLIGGSESAHLQVFEITAEGTIKISKHGHWIDRTTEDVIRLDGKKVHGGIHLWQ